jgi:hypothetical protein
MQTFLPYPDFNESLRCLDSRRLGKQRVEAFQILNTLLGKSKGWQNHPAVKMWKGYEPALTLYYNVSLEVWAERGYQNVKLQRKACCDCPELPTWIGMDRFHASHRSNLLRKNPEFYRHHGWIEPSNLPYIWP